MIRRYFLLVLSIFAIPCFAQTDSLLRLMKASSGKAKLDLLCKLIVIDTAPDYYNHFNEAIALSASLNEPAGAAEAWCAKGDYHFDNNQPDSALNSYRKSLSLSRDKKLSREEILSLKKIAAVQLYNLQFSEALLSLNMALTVSRQINDKAEIAAVLQELGLFYYDQRDYTKALSCFEEQEQYDLQRKDTSSLAACYGNIGRIHLARGDYVTSLRFYDESLQLTKAKGDDKATAQAQLNTGIVCKEQGFYELALDYLLQSVRFFEKEKPGRELASCLNTIGNIYLELGATDQALSYHFRSLKIRQDIHFDKGISFSLTNIGDVYKRKGDYAAAEDYLERSLALKEKLGDKLIQASSLGLLGEVCFLRKKYEEAEVYYKRALEIQRETQDPKGTATTLNNLGALYSGWGKYDQALSCLSEARSIAQHIGAKAVLLSNYDICSRLFKTKGDSPNALLFREQYMSLKDTLFNEQKTKALAELQIKYETEKKQQEINHLSEKNRAQEAIVLRQDLLIVSLSAIGILLALAAFFAIKAYRSKKKLAEQNQLIIEQKQTMMRELHHRVKNNLQVLSSVLNLQQTRVTDEQTKDALLAVEHRLDAMLLIHQDLYSHQDGSNVNIEIYIRRLVNNLLSSFSDFKVQVNIASDHSDCFLDADRALCAGFICNEIMSNSFKHAFSGVEQPKIEIEIGREQKQIKLRIADNGSGMPDAVSPETTNSFGLRLIHLFVKDIRGTINITSNSKGTCYEIIIPEQVIV